MTVISILENTIKTNLENIRPPEHMRDQLDIGYSFINNVLILFEIRPSFIDKDKILNIEFAKTRYFKSKEIWKIYWKRANDNWDPYKIEEVSNIDAFFKIIKEDKYGCFLG
ncbi:DUF3024 domain-containing protein [Flavobacterium sp.]|uniref:DUF3024 domain-containing protein n=1 Tax=Flavobacterium sp. TaxID=239 RepID=UPI00286E3A28|nr:DUF3024 domain-containing protein [Flavobacterium sp.]